MDQLEQVKDLLSEPKNRIKLHDFVVDITRKLLSEVSLEKLPVQVASGGASFIARLEKYQEIIQTALPFQMLLGRWGLPDHAETSARDILLASVFKAMGEMHDVFKLLPGLERKRTPQSEHIYTLLEPYADQTLYLGTDYEELFDRAEIVMAIEYMHFEHPEPVGKEESLWGPSGRFGWKRSPNPLDRLIAEASAAEKNWEPAQAGLFGGSAARFVELAAGLSRRLSQIAW